MDKKNGERKTKNLWDFVDGKNYLVVVDEETREEISRREVPEAKRRKGIYFTEKEYFTMHERICRMLKHKNYNTITFRLFFELLDRIEFNNRIKTFRQAELAEILKVHQPKISASLKILEKDEVIKKVNHDYYFTPKFIRYANDGFADIAFSVDEIENLKGAELNE
jgi:DNA-binding MarR family transcriptional regulator